MAEPAQPQDINLNGDDEEQLSPEAPQESEQPASDQPIEGDEAEVEEAEEAPEEQPKPSRREQLRIQTLLERYGKPEAPVQQPQPASAPTQPATTWDLAQELDADPETIKRLQDDREAYANKARTEVQAQIDARFSTMSFESNLNADAPYVNQKYSFLDTKSDDFDKNAYNAMVGKYFTFVGAKFDNNNKLVAVDRPGIRYADYVEAEMELVDELANRRVQEATTTVKRQVAQTGIRPNGSAPKTRLNLNKPASEMTDAELQAKVNSLFKA